MATQLKLGEIAVDVILKDIKNVHLGVYPPDGKVRISAPSRMQLDIMFLPSRNSVGSSRSRKNFVTRNAKRVANISIAKASMSGASVTCSK
jgi:hypothetical protein